MVLLAAHNRALLVVLVVLPLRRLILVHLLLLRNAKQLVVLQDLRLLLLSVKRVCVLQVHPLLLQSVKSVQQPMVLLAAHSPAPFVVVEVNLRLILVHLLLPQSVRSVQRLMVRQAEQLVA
jgi:hypothetical protein